MQLTHRIQLKPTPAQADYFVRACSTARFVWNWALAEWNRQYAAGQKPRAMAIKKQFNAIKYQRYPWLRGIHRDAHSQPFEHIDRAWKRFVGEVRSGSKPHAPRFKHKGRCRDSFYVANDRFKVSGQIVRLPLIGEVTMTEVLRFTGKILGATVSRTAQRWFIAIQVEVPDAQYRRPRTADGVVGVDLGVKCAVTLSTSEMVHSPMPLKAALRRVRIRSRRLSRKVETARAQQKLIHGPHLPCCKGLPLTGNRRKSSEALARLHGRIARTRADFTHKLTTRLCRENQTVVIEDLNVKGMLANERLARAIADVGFGALRSQLEYKARRYGTQIIPADRWFPSSKLCSRCGWKYDALTLKEREWTCTRCGTGHDRDLNAALNLKRLATRTALTVASQPVTADTEAGMVPASVGKVTPVRYECGQQDASGQEGIRAHICAPS